MRRRFAPSWTASKAEMEVLADRAAKKNTLAKRIGVIHDTTTFKRVGIARKRNSPGTDVATDDIFDERLHQILVQQLVRLKMSRGKCPEHIVEQILLLCGIALPWHPHQPHLAEWQAYSAREILFNLDMSIEAKNLAIQRAAKHKALTVDDDSDDANNDHGRP